MEFLVLRTSRCMSECFAGHCYKVIADVGSFGTQVVYRVVVAHV